MDIMVTTHILLKLEMFQKKLNVTKESLYIGIEKMQVNNRVGDIDNAIQNYVNQHGYGMLKN